MTVMDEQPAKLSIDLSHRCIDHFKFLMTLHDSGVTRRVTNKNLQRYFRWLDLLVKEYDAQRPIDQLAPPLDVAWLWHCHRLAPKQYQEYLQVTYQNKLSNGDHVNGILQLKDLKGDPYNLKTNKYTEQVWHVHYPSEAFDWIPDACEIESLVTSKGDVTDTVEGYDLLKSAKSQAEFYWQIQPLFEETSHRPVFDTNAALADYCRFLHLFQKYPKRNLVPTYKIDLYWHTHMTGGSANGYHDDCVSFTGRLVDHDDSFGDGNRDGVLGDAFLETAALWRQEYGDTSYAESGGYRGPPPPDYYVEAREEFSPSYPVGSINMDPVVEVGGNKSPVPEMASEKKDSSDLESASVTSSTSDLTSKSACRRYLPLMLLFVFGVGVTLIVLGYVVIHENGAYACEGIPPSIDEIQGRGAPVCLRTNIRAEPMCLQSNPGSSSSVWCHTNVLEYDEYQNWYLWWSPCASCGTAWRMWKEIDHDKSRYKYLLDEEPMSHEVPPSAIGTNQKSWMEWDAFQKRWSNVDDVTFEVCDGELDEIGIPMECYIEKEVIWIAVVGWILSALSAFALLIFTCCMSEWCMNILQSNGNGKRGSRTKRRSTQYHTAAAGCGGGGCGGGGCGGC